MSPQTYHYVGFYVIPGNKSKNNVKKETNVRRCDIAEDLEDRRDSAAARRWIVKRGIYGGSCGEDNIVIVQACGVRTYVSEISRQTEKRITSVGGGCRSSLLGKSFKVYLHKEPTASWQIEWTL